MAENVGHERERRVMLVLAAVLAIALVVLLMILLTMVKSESVEYETISGIEPVAMIDGPGTGRFPRFGRPMGVAFGRDGRVYVTDAKHDRVCVFDSKGRFLFEFGGSGIAKPLPGEHASWQPGLLNYPVGIDVASDGTVYVADFRNDQIQVFTPNGRYLRSFPDARSPVGKGSSGQDGAGIAVTDVAVTDSEVYATDRYQVFVFDTNGRLLRQFGRPGPQPGGMNHPNGVAVGDGVVYVADSNHSRVQAFTADGNLVWTRGTPATGMHPTDTAQLTLPRGLTVLRDGRVLVADAFQFSLVSIRPDGRIQARYGDRGAMPGEFMFPNDVDSRGALLAVADKDNQRVQLVRLVNEKVR